MEILPDLSICVIGRRSEEVITGFLRSLFAAPGYADLQVIVILADSDLGEKLGQEFSEALIYEESDLSAPDTVIYNRALQFATGRYLALVSENVVCEPAVLERLLNFMDDEPDIGLIGPRLLLPSGDVAGSVRLFLSVVSFLLIECSSQDLPLAKVVRQRHLLADWSRDSSREVQWLSGVFLLFRREVMEEIGLLDEGYVDQYGDLDYCYRARRAGWHNHFLHDAEMGLLDAQEQDLRLDSQRILDGLRFLIKKSRSLWS